MLAQAVTGTPGHVNAMAESVNHFIADIGPDDIFEGDVYITNDPWKATGHLHDITIVSPSFHRGSLIGYFACTAHVVDIGGRGFGPDAREVYEEGLFIPIMKLFARGAVNRDLINIVRNNVRESDKVVGDLYALAACNETGHRRLIDMLDEFGLADLDGIGAFILARSRQATIERIAALPHGTFCNRLTVDGYDEPIELAVTLTIAPDGIWPISQARRREPLRHQRAADLRQGLCLLRPEMRRRAGDPQQRRLAVAIRRRRPARLHPQRTAAGAGFGAPRARPFRARSGAWRAAPMPARPHPGRRCQRALEPAHERPSDR